MNVNELFPSRFVKGEDIDGKTVHLTIKNVTMEEMGKDRESHPVVWFNEAKKGLVLKKGNAQAIAKLHGPETNDWGGKRITLYTEKMRAFGETQTVIKVASTVPAAPQPKVERPEAEQPAPTQTVMSEEYRQYLLNVVKLSTRHDSLFEESSDLSDLVAAMRDWDRTNDEVADWVPMPTVPSPGKAMSMYSYLLERIEKAVEMDRMGEPILSYLLGRVVTGATPPSLECKPLLDDLMGDCEYVDALMACGYIIKDQVQP